VEKCKYLDLWSSRSLANITWQDLLVLCHPYLRKHENFCRLLYIASEPHLAIPLLVLKLAVFGSLKNAIESKFEPPRL
jgi:hypothetical protein